MEVFALNRRSMKHWGALLVLLVIFKLMLSGCSSFYDEKGVFEVAEGQLGSKVTVDVKEMEFGQLIVSQFVVQEVRDLVAAEKFVLLTSDSPEGIVVSLDEPLYVFNVEGDVTLAVLARDNRILGKTVVPAGTYQKTYELFAPKEAVVVRDLAPVI